VFCPKVLHDVCIIAGNVIVIICMSHSTTGEKSLCMSGSMPLTVAVNYIHNSAYHGRAMGSLLSCLLDGVCE